MTEPVIIRGPGEGRSLQVGGGDYVTYKATSAETEGDFFCFEVVSPPGFGPPLHRHAYRELFYILEGTYEFTIARDGAGAESVKAGPGTTVSVQPQVPHTFSNPTDRPARMLCVQNHATLEGFFEEFGVPVESVPGEAVGAIPANSGPPDFSVMAAMAAALERNGVTVLVGSESD